MQQSFFYSQKENKKKEVPDFLSNPEMPKTRVTKEKSHETQAVIYIMF